MKISELKELANKAYLLDFSSGCSDNIVLSLTSAIPRMSFYSDQDNFIEVISNVALTENEWNHLAAVYDGIEGRIYVNGAQTGSSPSNWGPKRIVRNLPYIGTSCAQKYQNTLYFYFDEIGIFNVALNNSEISSMASLKSI